jgi:hypothetical protein
MNLPFRLSPFRMAQRKETLINGLIAEYYPDGILISGRTFDSKDALKALGAVWSPPLKKWKLPLETDLSSFRPQVPPQGQPRPQEQSRGQLPSRATVYEPNMWVYDRMRDKRRSPCCSQCKTELDKFRPDGPLWYVCPQHGKWQSDYTGD